MDVIELHREDSENSRSVRARLDDGEFRIETRDAGPLVEKVWGDSDYEYWTAVPKEHWGRLLMALAKELFREDAEATERLRELCRRHGVGHVRDHWI